MKKIQFFIVVFIVGISFQQINAQIPDNTDGRLYRLCKTWGYFKYFSQNQCDLVWDTLLYTTVNDVLVANTNAEFNQALMTMFNKVGNNVTPLVQGPEPDTNLNFNNSWINDPIFSQPVRGFLDTFSINITPNTSTCLVKFNDYNTPNYRSYLDFRGDPLSMPANLADEAYRLTFMFYYWNVMNYFFPYRNLMDQEWDSTLVEFVPQFRQAQTEFEFHKTFLKMATHINDTHGSTGSNLLLTNFWGGGYMPNIYFTRIDTNCVVAKVENIPGVMPGDILTALKGIQLSEIEDSLSAFIPASTPAALYRNMYYQMLVGGLNSSLEMTFSDKNNNSYSINTSRTMTYSSWVNWRDYTGLSSSYFITDCGYGYVDMRTLQDDEISTMYDAFKDAPAIIFDIRNYPNIINMWDLVELLFPTQFISAIWYDNALTWLPAPYYYYYLPGWYYQENDYYNMGTWVNPDAYQGNIYILINEKTQSYAEYLTQYISFHPNAKVIGTQTAGADGNVSYLLFPGSIYTYFTSMGWYYADGYQQQRNGVRIDSVVSPTIKGIREGRDEILEAALDCLTRVEDITFDETKISVYPNPATNRFLKVALTLESSGEITLSLFNLTGDIIFRQAKYGVQGKNVLNCKLPDLALGVYFLQVQYGKQISNTKVVME